MSPQPTPGESDLAEAHAIVTASNIDGGAERRIAAALAERERKIWQRVLDIAAVHMPEKNYAVWRADHALRDILRAAREATK